MGLTPTKPKAHPYQHCGDSSCERFACRIYREGYADGYDDGYRAGYDAGRASGYSEGYTAGFSDGAHSASSGR